MRHGRVLSADQLRIAEKADHTLEQWLACIEGPNQIAVRNFYADHYEILETAPGSRGSHHGWEGGYKEHVRQTMALTNHLFDFFVAEGILNQLPDEEQFTLGDALTVMFLHDIEKPFMYGNGVSDSIKQRLETKDDRKKFRADKIEAYGFELTPTMQNALEFVEGVYGDDYVPGERADQPLAALCHSADTISARAMYDYHRK